MPLADCVIDLLMEWDYKYPDKVADRTNDVNQKGSICFSFAGPPSDTNFPDVQDTSPRLVRSFTRNRTLTGHYVAIGFLMLHRNYCLFKSFESAIRRNLAWSPFCLHSGTVGFHILQSAMPKAANYRVDIPRVLQRFSINFKPPDPGFVFFFTVCM